MPGWNCSRNISRGIVAATLLAFPIGRALQAIAQQHIETSSFNQAPGRPPEDPQQVQKGKDLYDNQCASCHSGDLRGKENAGPNLLRSQDALTDKQGDNLLPIIQGTKKGMTGHQFAPDPNDANAIAAYVRSVIAKVGSQGRPPGDSTRSPNILVGDAAQGKQYFAAKCAGCHSVDADLKGFGSKLSSPKTLQAAWLRGTHLGVPAPPVTVAVTEPGKPALAGTLIHIDDFFVTLKNPDAGMVTVRRRGALPKVQVHDPLQGHRDLLTTYTDKDIHDVTAYLVTLK